MSKKFYFSLVLCFVALIAFQCKKDVQVQPTEQSSKFENAPSSNTKKSAIGVSAFSLWGTCSTQPFLIGSTGINVPVGGTECSTNYLAAQQKTGQSAGGFSFYGCFKGGSNAPSGANEMSVFLCDNITTWTGREFGFTKTLNDNALKAYLQSPGNVFIYQTLLLNDNGYHTFKAQCQSGDHSKVDFYIDNVYKLTLQNPGINYWYNWDYFVGTTHRTSSNWSSTGQQIEMYSINVW